MVERVEPFAHIQALSPLDCDLIHGQGSKQNEKANGIAEGPVGPDLGDTGFHLVSKVVLSNIEQVGCGASNC